MSRLAVCIRHVEFAAGNQTVYVVKVRQDNEEWEVRRAYSDFRKLREDVQKVMRDERHQLVSDDCSLNFLQSLQSLEFPSKRLFGSKKESVIKERALELHSFLIKLLSLAHKYRKAQKVLYDKDHDVGEVTQGSVSVFYLMRDFLKPIHIQPVVTPSTHPTHSTLSVDSNSVDDSSDSVHAVRSIEDDTNTRSFTQQVHQLDQTDHLSRTCSNDKESISYRASPKKKSPRSGTSNDGRVPINSSTISNDSNGSTSVVQQPHKPHRSTPKSKSKVISISSRNLRSASSVDESTSSSVPSSHFRTAMSLDGPNSISAVQTQNSGSSRGYRAHAGSGTPSHRHIQPGTDSSSSAASRSHRSTSSGENPLRSPESLKTAVVVERVEDPFSVMRVAGATVKSRPKERGFSADAREKKTRPRMKKSRSHNNKANACESEPSEQWPRVSAQLAAQSISVDAQKELERYLTEYNAIMILRYVDRFISKAVAKTSGCYTVSAENKLLIDSERFFEELEDTFTDLPSDFDGLFKNAVGDWVFPHRLDAYVQMKWDSFHGRSSVGAADVTGGRNSDSDDESDSEYEYTESVGGRLLKKQNFTEEEVDVLQEMIANGTAGTEQMLRLRRQMNDTMYRRRQCPTESDSDDD